VFTSAGCRRKRSSTYRSAAAVQIRRGLAGRLVLADAIGGNSSGGEHSTLTIHTNIPIKRGGEAQRGQSA